MQIFVHVCKHPDVPDDLKRLKLYLKTDITDIVLSVSHTMLSHMDIKLVKSIHSIFHVALGTTYPLLLALAFTHAHTCKLQCI